MKISCEHKPFWLMRLKKYLDSSQTFYIIATNLFQMLIPLSVEAIQKTQSIIKDIKKTIYWNCQSL